MLTDHCAVLWRSPIGASGILNFFLGILPTPGLRPLLRSHALRLIGNSCADTGGCHHLNPGFSFAPTTTENIELTQHGIHHHQMKIEPAL